VPEHRLGGAARDPFAPRSRDSARRVPTTKHTNLRAGSEVARAAEHLRTQTAYANCLRNRRGRYGARSRPRGAVGGGKRPAMRTAACTGATATPPIRERRVTHSTRSACRATGTSIDGEAWQYLARERFACRRPLASGRARSPRDRHRRLRRAELRPTQSMRGRLVRPAQGASCATSML
jgi:hypothetical protein